MGCKFIVSFNAKSSCLDIENGNIEGCVRRRGDTIGIGEFRNEE